MNELRPTPTSLRPARGNERVWPRAVVARILPPVVAALLLVLLWDGATRFFRVSPFLCPPPIAVAQGLWHQRALMVGAAWLTAQAALTGLFLSTCCGTLIAVGFAQSAWLRYALYPYAIFLQTVPVVAIAPLLVLWFGYGIQGVIAVAFVLSLFPIIANVTAGMTSVPRPMRELFSLYRATRWQRFLKLQMPHAVPHLITGIKTSSGLSVIGAIVGEFFVGYGDRGVGLGYLIRSSSESMQTEQLFAAVLLSTGLGVVVFALMSLVSETVLRRWHAT